MSVEIIHGDCLVELLKLAERGAMVDAVVVDPPYHLGTIVRRFSEASPDDDTQTSERVRTRADGYARLASGFMSQKWDAGGIAFDPETWRKVFAVMKPGAHLLAFGGTKGFHRLACAIEDAGFEIRNTCVWAYSTGFPKSLDIAKAIDKAAGSPATESAAEWEGWGTDLKPAVELICLARKPLSEKNVAANVLRWSTGGINIDGCRIGDSKEVPVSPRRAQQGTAYSDLSQADGTTAGFDPNVGRFPANLMWDGSEEVEAIFPSSAGAQGDVSGQEPSATGDHGIFGHYDRVPYTRRGEPSANRRYADNGSTDFAMRPGERREPEASASRFFFSPKADKDDRWASRHPTVKPLGLIRYLVRLITPPGGTVLDCFAGTGTTAVAAIAEGFVSIVIEREDEYVADLRERVAFYQGETGHSLASKGRKLDEDIALGRDLPLFAAD